RFANAGEMRDALAQIVDGPRITKDKIVAVDGQYKSIVQPKLAITDGMLKAVARTGLSMSGPTEKKAPPKKDGNVILLATFAGMAVMLSAVGFVGYSFMKKGSKPEEMQPPTVAAAPAA